MKPQTKHGAEPEEVDRRADWEKEFDNLFQDMDVWTYCNPITDPHGISSKEMNGKKKVKQFIADTVAKTRKEVVEEIKRQLEMTILLKEKFILDNQIVDWSESLRSFIKIYLDDVLDQLKK